MFKVEDEVRVVGNSDFNGRIGVVKFIDDSPDWSHHVSFDDTRLVCEAQTILALKFPLSRPRADAKLTSILDELAGSGYLFAPQLVEEHGLALPVIAR